MSQTSRSIFPNASGLESNSVNNLLKGHPLKPFLPFLVLILVFISLPAPAQSVCSDGKTRWQRFSLSQRERAGVRENESVLHRACEREMRPISGHTSAQCPGVLTQ